MQQLRDLQKVDEDDGRFESENMTELDDKLGVTLHDELVLDESGSGRSEGPYESYLLCTYQRRGTYLEMRHRSIGKMVRLQIWGM